MGFLRMSPRSAGRGSIGQRGLRPADRPCHHRAVAGSIAGLLGLAVVLAGCSSGQAPRAVRTTTTSTTTNPKQAVLTAWAAAQQAIADAELHGDANWPALYQTMVNPELAHVQAVIRIAQQEGYTAKGSFRVIRSEVTSYTPTRATIQGCVWGGVIAYQANGQPAPGNAGKATYGVEQGVMVPAGSGWALQDGTAHQFNTAQEAGPLCAD